jgi:hypothetical protein
MTSKPRPPNGKSLPGSMNRRAATAHHRAEVAARANMVVTNTAPPILPWDTLMEQAVGQIPIGRYTPEEEGMNLLLRMAMNGALGGVIYRVHKRAEVLNLKEAAENYVR